MVIKFLLIYQLGDGVSSIRTRLQMLIVGPQLLTYQLSRYITIDMRNGCKTMLGDAMQEYAPYTTTSDCNRCDWPLHFLVGESKSGRGLCAFLMHCLRHFIPVTWGTIGVQVLSRLTQVLWSVSQVHKRFCSRYVESLYASPCSTNVILQAGGRLNIICIQNLIACTCPRSAGKGIFFMVAWL